MTIATSRSLNRLVEEQLNRWRAQKREEKKVTEVIRPEPCITISREPGSGGSEIARRLARALTMDIIGAQIIQQVAERAEMSEKVIASLDEKAVRLMDSWLDSLFQTRHLWPDEYLHHLTQVIATIGRQGNAVIVGRGANFILPSEETFRVRVIAPREIRIRNVMRDSKADWKTAENYVYKTEADRSAYIRKHFQIDWTNPDLYDLIVNTGHMGIEGAVEGVKASFLVWKEVRPSRSGNAAVAGPTQKGKK
jgi:cytidylate kinase